MARRPPSKGLLRNCGPKAQSLCQAIFTPCCGQRFGNYMSAVYLLTKVIMLANVIGQLFLLNRFLGFDYNFYGIYVIQAMIRGEEWHESPRFPRVTLCDFDIRRLGNLHRYSVQCVLTINLFNEMIYLIIWFWFVFVAFMTTIGILLLVSRWLFTQDRYTYIEKHLVIDNVYNPDKEKDRIFLRRFVEEYLRQDGVLMLRLVGHNTNKVVVNEFICNLFEFYKNKLTAKKSVEDRLLSDTEDEI